MNCFQCGGTGEAIIVMNNEQIKDTCMNCMGSGKMCDNCGAPIVEETAPCSNCGKSKIDLN